MKRFVPGLVICGAIVAVGSGIAAFSRSTGGVWDVVFLISVLAFLTLFLVLLQSKAASTMFGAEHATHEHDPPA